MLKFYFILFCDCKKIFFVKSYVENYILKYMMNVWIFIFKLLYNFYAIKFLLYEKYRMLHLTVIKNYDDIFIILQSLYSVIINLCQV